MRLAVNDFRNFKSNQSHHSYFQENFLLSIPTNDISQSTSEPDTKIIITINMNPFDSHQFLMLQIFVLLPKFRRMINQETRNSLANTLKSSLIFIPSKDLFEDTATNTSDVQCCVPSRVIFSF